MVMYDRKPPDENTEKSNERIEFFYFFLPQPPPSYNPTIRMETNENAVQTTNMPKTNKRNATTTMNPRR